MVALSVSISAISSPISTSSPRFLSQRTTVPSVMVSESLGISIYVAMGRRVRRELGPKASSGQYRGIRVLQDQREKAGRCSSKSNGLSSEGEPAENQFRLSA